MFEAQFMRVVSQMTIDEDFGLRLEVHGCVTDITGSTGTMLLLNKLIDYLLHQFICICVC